MLHSVITHGGEPVVVHYLHGPRFPHRKAQKLERMFVGHPAEIVFHEIPDRQLGGLPLDHRFGPAMWYRIFLPELLPELTQILYLDVDTLVTDTLDPLWDTALDECFLAAVTNVFMEYHRHRAPELGIDMTDYFNSGVLMFNLAAMRTEDFAERLVDVVRQKGSQLLWPDQDALNLITGPRWVRLHPRWNVMNSFATMPQLAADVFGPQRLGEAIGDPAVRHFEGPGLNKPWHARHEGPDQQLYREHRQASPWPRVRLEGNSPLARLRRALGDREET
jgi:lipopolysaccharide biosynthesis glycosyltransferase